jgi:hypothetical protein
VELVPVEEQEAVLGRQIGGCGPSAGKPPMRVLTDSSLSGAKAQMWASAATFGWVPASVITAPP